MAKFRDSIAGSVIILAAICLVVTLALSATNSATSVIIKEAEAAAAASGLGVVMPGVESFTLVEGVDFPEGVTAANMADSGEGYVFSVTANGYGGAINFLIAMDNNGNYLAVKALDGHSETVGIGTRVFDDPDYLASVAGKNSPEDIDALAGATVTSTAVKNALGLAAEAFALVG